jgi:hypothetical protein
MRIEKNCGPEFLEIHRISVRTEITFPEFLGDALMVQTFWNNTEFLYDAKHIFQKFWNLHFASL